VCVCVKCGCSLGSLIPISAELNILFIYLFNNYFATSATNKDSDKFYKSHNSVCRHIIKIYFGE